MVTVCEWMESCLCWSDFLCCIWMGWSLFGVIIEGLHRSDYAMPSSIEFIGCCEVLQQEVRDVGIHSHCCCRSLSGLSDANSSPHGCMCNFQSALVLKCLRIRMPRLAVITYQCFYVVCVQLHSHIRWGAVRVCSLAIWWHQTVICIVCEGCFVFPGNGSRLACDCAS